MKNIKEILLGLVFVGIIGAGIYFATTEKVVPEGITKTVVENGIENYKGKTTAVLIAGTFCPHCQKDVPEVEREVFEKADLNSLNLVVNVTDGEKGKSFNTKMKQVFNKDLSFKELTGEECRFVPT
jgi:thiol-disulfide isomerase/thioredoxin